MQLVESLWIRSQLEGIPDEDLFPLVDLGSSSLEYRTRYQPFIQENVFAPLAARGGRVWHTDLKPEPGIDLVGDLLDPGFCARLAQLGARTVTAFNVLTHVTDRHAFARTALQLVPAGGYLMVTGPHRLPATEDPVDTRYRPTATEAATLFPGTEVVASTMIDGGNWRQWRADERGRSLPRTVLRMATPFYRPKQWLDVARQAPYLFRSIQTFGLVLRKR